MNVTDPVVIQELVVCSQKQLTKVAKKHEISVPRAQVVRDHWIRRITSRCVQCNVLVKGDICPKCKSPKQPATKLLREVRPKEVILRRECACGRPFYYSAGYILKMFGLKGTFKPSRKCPKCRERPKGTTKKMQVRKKKKQTAVSKKVKTARPTNPKAKKKEGPLTFRPFTVLEGLKVKN